MQPFPKHAIGAILLCALTSIAVGEDSGWHGAVRNSRDVNGDGVCDLLVRAKKVWLLSGRDGSVLWTAQGLRAGDGFGSCMDAAGDVDQDGVPDVIVGAFDRYRAFAGRSDAYATRYAQVLSGRDGHLIHHFVGGSSVAGAGDLNLDGIPDLLVGSRSALGLARAYSGRDGSVLFELRPDPQHYESSDGFGASLLGLGDVDGDGYGDIAVGAPGDEEEGRGVITLFSGRTQSVIATAAGIAPASYLGWTLAQIGDVDKDGVTDLVGGAINRYAEVFSGKSMKSLGRVYSKNAWSRYDGFAQSLDSIGDVDSDGCSDFVVGANDFANRGYAVIYSGSDRSVISTVVEFPWGGIDVCAMGDVDGDHAPDIAIIFEPQAERQPGPPRAAWMLRVVSPKTECVLYEVDLGRL